MKRAGTTRKVALVLAFLSLVLPMVGGCLRRPGKQPTKLTYRLPTKITIAVGKELPGTGIRYERMSEKGAHMTIKGQQALKRKGDSLDWSGNLAPGVSGDLALRVVWHTEDQLHLVGRATLEIDDVNPRTGPILTSSPVSYTGPVAYGVARGAGIPGSPITYEGRTEEGAKLGGIEGYPYRKTGDSILWEGTLRDGVYLRLDVRVLQYDDKGLRAGGLATLWIGS